MIEYSRSVNDIWFAWYPVRIGALAGGRWVWLKRVWRNRTYGRTLLGQFMISIYQELDT